MRSFTHRKAAGRPERRIPAPALDISEMFFAMCKNVDSPHSLALWLCYKYDHAAFVELTLDPGNYGDTRLARLNPGGSPQAFAYDLMCHEILSKYKGLRLPVKTKDTAIALFKQGESRCAEINLRLKGFRSAEMPRFEAIISIARRKISEILMEVRQAQFEFGWGPGSTYTVKGDVAWDKKILEKRISVTASALPIAQTVVGADIHWCNARGIPSEGPCSLLASEFLVVPGSRITTVPKNAKTDRTIAIEPTANIYLQKGIGAWIRRRLRVCCRINLDDQSTNQKFAARLSYATIDLKAASDSISRELVRLLLPEEWADLLDWLRSPCYKMDGAFHQYEKWSSMGNGYTFELESMIFYALSFAVQSIGSEYPHVLVYGDDILVPVQHAEPTIACLAAFGFEANTKKTHYRSLYRESCGAHFYDGVLITPVYQKEEPSDVEEVYHLANRLRHLATRLGGYHYSDKTVFGAWSTVIRSIRPTLRHSPLHFVEHSRSVCTRQGVPRNRHVEPMNDSLPGTVHLSIEDCQSLGLHVFSYGTKIKKLTFVAKKKRFDQAAGLCFSFQQQSTLDGLETVALRGRGVMRWRDARSHCNFSSNVWL